MVIIINFFCARDTPTTSSSSSSLALATRFADLKCFNKSTIVFSPIPGMVSSSVFKAVYFVYFCDAQFQNGGLHFVIAELFLEFHFFYLNIRELDRLDRIILLNVLQFL